MRKSVVNWMVGAQIAEFEIFTHPPHVWDGNAVAAMADAYLQNLATYAGEEFTSEATSLAEGLLNGMKPASDTGTFEVSPDGSTVRNV